MEGLKDILLVPRSEHQMGWAGFFEEQQHEIRKLIGDYNHPVEWFGSTSIPSVEFAKPVLDIAVAQEPGSKRLARFLGKRLYETGERRLQNSIIGFTDKNKSQFYCYDRNPDDVGRLLTHQVATMPQYEDCWTKYFHFKQLLTEYPQIGQMYSETKLGIAKRFPANIVAYTNAKSPFVSAAVSLGFEKYGRSKASDETVEAARASANPEFYAQMKKIVDEKDAEVSEGI